MFVIEWWAALVSFLSVIGLYIYVKRRKSLISINWGSSTQANIYRKTLEYSFKLNATEEHVKNFRPNFLVLTGELIDRPALLHLIAGITKSKM
jgi:solute carrier family 12 sodium/potassium/chloride transporter 2